MDSRPRGSLERVDFQGVGGHHRRRASSEARICSPIPSLGRQFLLRPQCPLGSAGQLRYAGASGCGSSDRIDARFGSTLNGSGQRNHGGTLTPPLGATHLANVTDMTRHLSLTKLKDITMSLMPGRSREITFTVPPTVSPLSPRRGFGDMGLLSPMSSPRRPMPSDEVTPTGSQTAFDYVGGGDSRATTPSPCLGKPFVPDNSTLPGACSLGSINPDLYKEEDLEDNLGSYPEDHLGRVWFRVDYEAEAEKLKVTLIRAKHLPSRTAGSTNCCDPFVRLHLMPDERRYLQTKVKRKTCDPRFDEVFVFQITAKELQERALKITFFDVIRDKRHQTIGHILFLLKDIKTKLGKIQKMDITKEITVSPLEAGELQVSLCYNDNLERLTVTVGDTRNLKIPENIRQFPVEFQSRISLMQQAKVVKSKKTEVVRSEKSPSFNESFIFKVPADQLDVTAISISVNANKKSDAMLGRVLLGPFMFARGKPNEHWVEMVSRMREHVQMWHSIS